MQSWRLRLIPARAGNTSRSPRESSITSAHPRSRGEHPRKRGRSPSYFGSSPLARGTPAAVSLHTRYRRLIPARAGNTSTESPPLLAQSAHPRSRGEHGAPSFSRRSPGGSSPLARGTRVSKNNSSGAPRLIPARAGNTFSGILRREAFEAHPRSRGEHSVQKALAPRGFGSSPLARGTPRCCPPGVKAFRLIPARAGNTSFALSLSSAAAGSSPLARGTRAWCRRRCRVVRLIPARAGNTFSGILRREAFEAHPRSRGEHSVQKALAPRGFGSSPLARGTPRCCPPGVKAFRLIPARAGNTSFALSLSSAAAGSSPLARGTRAWCRRRCRVVRLIPARAGNTASTSSPLPSPTAHPRSRGEHPGSYIALWAPAGSSPLARGTLSGIRRGRRSSRLIPARAGNTS